MSLDPLGYTMIWYVQKGSPDSRMNQKPRRSPAMRASLAPGCVLACADLRRVDELIGFDVLST